MTFIEKSTKWVKQTGVSNLGWIGGFAVTAFYGQWFIAGGTVGIFLYSNWNVIRKLLSDITDGRESDTQ